MFVFDDTNLGLQDYRMRNCERESFHSIGD